MSINRKSFSRAALIGAEIFAFLLLSVAAQDLKAFVKISAAAPSVAQISGETAKSSGANWFFEKPDADDSGARISDFQLFDSQNREIAVKKLIDGEYLAENAEAVRFRYRINLAPLPNEMSRAPASWVSDQEQGILMLSDLLPQGFAENQTRRAEIKIELPPDWKTISGEKPAGENVYRVENIARAVFAVGKNWRETQSANLDLAISGEWQFSDAEAAQTASEIHERYRKFFGDADGEAARIFLIRLPKTAKYGRWTAETRGRNLLVFSADKPFKTPAIQLLHEQLRHELFHLWIPNKLNLKGDYDWFYEGFTVYQALRTGLQMNQIRFEDFLATLAEAYNLDALQTAQASLVESSKNRRNGAHRQVYARGMLVAFLCDAALLSAGKKAHSIENVFRKIYAAHRFPNEAADGSRAIVKILNEYPPLRAIVEKYIESARAIEWETDLQRFGIESATENSPVKLRVKAKLSGRQKDLLDELGYNNWRKISGKTK